MTSPRVFAYQAVYRYVLGLIESAPPQVEQKLPSLRQLAQRLNVSVSTTKYAYALLEDEGRIHARPKFGYFTRVSGASVVPASGGSLLDRVFSSARQPGMLALSSDAPAMLLSLDSPLLALEREQARQYPRAATPLFQPFGEPELRSVLAERYTESTEHAWQAEQVYIGADLRSVLELALNALELAGTVALVESPCSWAVLRQLQAAGIRGIEIPLDSNGRFDLQQFEAILQHEPVRLAVLSSTLNSPHGSRMPAEDKQQICRWLAERSVWLFENDAYGELSFEPRPARYRAFADPRRILVFSALDKMIGAEAPYGYVLCRAEGPALQRQFFERAARLSPIRQRAIARLLGSRRIDVHLVQLRTLLQERMQRMLALLQQHCAGLVHVHPAAGGATLWVEALGEVDMARVFERLLADRIVIAPGEFFSLQGQWRQYLRLSFTLDWSQDIPRALKCLARAIKEQAQLTP